jgi:hypothetical protein
MTDTYAEARGPHLPDAVTRYGSLVWIFVVLAVARLVWFVRESPPVQPLDLATILTYAAAVIPAVIVVLFPAALLLRHPDAPERARTLVVGTVLFAIVEGLRVLSRPLQPAFEQLTPGDEATPFLVPLALIYSAAVGLLGSFALANIGLGLARTRRYEDAAGSRIGTALMIGAVVLVLVGNVVSVTQLRLDAIPMTPTVIAYLVSSVALSVIFAAALAYLAAVTIRGARAGERPESGWTLAAVGAGLIIAAYTTRSWLVNVTPTPESQSLFLSIGYVLTITTALGYMALLGGLLLGLPSLDEVDDEEGDEDAIDEDAIDEDDVSASEGVPLDASADPSGARIEPA